jgi:hypothetical protein
MVYGVAASNVLAKSRERMHMHMHMYGPMRQGGILKVGSQLRADVIRQT